MLVLTMVYVFSENISDRYGISMIGSVLYTVYKATCVINNKSYIGFASNLHKRKAVHKSVSKKEDSKFYRAIRKHGFDNFEWEIVCQHTDKDYVLKVMEPFFILYYDTYNNGYNSGLGGDGNFGIILSEEARRKISEGNKIPKPQTKEHVKNRIDAMKRNNPDCFKTWLGKKHSQESIDKMSKAQKGVPKSEDHKRKMSYQMLNKQQAECPHCHKIGQYVNMKRWHFDNCKSLQAVV